MWSLRAYRGASAERPARTVRLNRTAYCHKITYICNINGLKDCPIRHRVDVGNPSQNISQKSGTSARDFCSSYLIEKMWVEFVSFRRANVQTFARTAYVSTPYDSDARSYNAVARSSLPP